MDLLPAGALRVGLGCQRLTSAGGPAADEAVGVIHAALDAGVRLLDTADVYGMGDGDRGQNERLVAGALASWSGDADEVVVATKGGMTRPGGRWVPDGRAAHLRAAARASRDALGGRPPSLYQLHAPDPRVPLATSLRALARLQRDGVVERVGLCNVRLDALEAAHGIADVAAVQVELGPLATEALRGGVAERCARDGIPLLAYRPLGGPERVGRVDRHPALCAVAERRGATPREVALAWLLALSPSIVPLPGATRVESARSIARAARLALTPEEMEELDAAFPAGRLLRVPRAERAPAAAKSAGEVVLLMGLPAAGKSTAAAEWVARGYARLNRDERGGVLRDLLPELERALEAGRRRVVLDNTYAGRAGRNEVIETAWRHGVPVRCVWLRTTLEQAQVNAVRRMVRRYGRLLEPDEMRAARRRDPGTFPPDVLLRYQRLLEPPAEDEGFCAVEERGFVAAPEAGYDQPAVLFEPDGWLRRARSGRPAPAGADDVELLPEAREALGRLAGTGARLLAVSHQPGIERGEVSEEQVQAAFARTAELLGRELEAVWCPHVAGPPRCWCQRPLPGLGVLLVERHRLHPGRSAVLGRSPAERRFAERLGMRYVDVTGPGPGGAT